MSLSRPFSVICAYVELTKFIRGLNAPDLAVSGMILVSQSV